MKSILVVLLCLLPILAGCSSSTTTGPTSSGVVCLWIGADKDTWVWFERPDNEWGQDGHLRVADYGDHKRSFVHFHLPILPEGTEILEAYLELYHGATSEDGYTDDIDIMVQRAPRPWSPQTLNWNSHLPFTPSSEFTIDLRSQAWSASADINQRVVEMFGDPANDHGFVVHYDNQSLTTGVEKGFHSNNYNRPADDLATAPRLLVKIELPEGKTTDDMVLPALGSDNDLDFPAGTEILMVKFAPGPGWPSSWNVVAAED